MKCHQDKGSDRRQWLVDRVRHCARRCIWVILHPHSSLARLELGSHLADEKMVLGEGQPITLRLRGRAEPPSGSG